MRLQIAFLLTLLLNALQAQQQPPTPAPQAAPPAVPQAPAPQATAAQTAAPGAATGNLVLNLPGASLREVIDTLARILKINYIIDQRVNGNITIQTYGEIRSTSARDLLDLILRINNAAMVQVGDVYRIVPTGDVMRLPMPAKNITGKEVQDGDQMNLSLIFLKYASVTEIVKLLTPFLGEGAVASTYEPANLLMLLDNGRNMKRDMELISMFDSDTMANQRIKSFELSNAKPSEMARDLETVFKAISLTPKGSNGLQFLPIDRLNTLIAIAPNPGIFVEVEKWIQKFDVVVKPPVGGTDNYVYRVKYGRADSIALAVTMLYASQFDNPQQMMTTMSMMMMMISMTSMLSGLTNGSSGGNNSANGAGGGGGAGGFGGIGNLGMGGMYGGMGGMYGGMGGMGMMGGFGMGGFGMGGFGMGGYGMGGYGGGQFPGGASGQASGLTGSSRPGDATGTFVGQQGQGGGGGAAPRVPRIVPNPFDNTLLMQCTPQEYEQLARLLNRLDVPPRQVLIEAKIYEVTLTGAFASGVQAFLQNRANNSGPKLLTGQTTGAGFNLTASMLVGQSRELLGFLTAQETEQRAKVINAPSIIATDNIAASINVGTSVPTLSSQAVSNIQNNGTSQFANTIASRNAGVNLSITARILPSGVVTLVINQEISSPQAPAASAAIQSPSFSQRNVSTQVTVQDGDTIAIGGIITESDTYSTAGVPFLHKLPLVGNAFGTRSKSKERTELVIFLTPRVIYDTPEIVEASDEIRTRFKRLNKIIREN